MSEMTPGAALYPMPMGLRMIDCVHLDILMPVFHKNSVKSITSLHLEKKEPYE